MSDDTIESHHESISDETPTPQFHEPQEGESVDWYDVALAVSEGDGTVHHTIEEKFTVVAVSEAMACEEAQHLCKEKYGQTGKVMETAELTDTQIRRRRQMADG